MKFPVDETRVCGWLSHTDESFKDETRSNNQKTKKIEIRLVSSIWNFTTFKCKGREISGGRNTCLDFFRCVFDVCVLWLKKETAGTHRKHIKNTSNPHQKHFWEIHNFEDEGAVSVSSLKDSSAVLNTAPHLKHQYRLSCLDTGRREFMDLEIWDWKMN